MQLAADRAQAGSNLDTNTSAGVRCDGARGRWWNCGCVALLPAAAITSQHVLRAGATVSSQGSGADGSQVEACQAAPQGIGGTQAGRTGGDAEGAQVAAGVAVGLARQVLQAEARLQVLLPQDDLGIPGAALGSVTWEGSLGWGVHQRQQS